MKTYQEVINRVADSGYHRLMSGSMNDPFYGENFSLISFIYNVSTEKIYKDSSKELVKIQKKNSYL